MKNHNLFAGFSLILSLVGANNSAEASTNTPAYWHCLNRLSGNSEYGTQPWACDSSSFGSDSYINELYKDVILDEMNNSPEELNRYMTALHALIRDSSEYYFKTRTVEASDAELKAWQNLVLAAITRESVWSHFRDGTDGHLKFTRGDQAHGWGLMQIDDRTFFADAKNGKAWDLMSNLVLGFGILYTGWVKAASAKCVSSPENWEERARSAYSFYNSGHDTCRWTNPKSNWHKNDAMFKQYYETKSWSSHVNDMNAQSSINVECAIESTDLEKTQCLAQK